MAQPVDQPRYGLSELSSDLEGILARETEQGRIVAEAEPLLGRFLQERSLAPEWSVPVPKVDVADRLDFTLYRLYRGKDDCFNIMVAIWPAGGGSGVHDHAGSWVVEGVYDGLLETVRYRRSDDGSRAGHAELEEVGRRNLLPGDVAHVISPDEAVHDFINPSSTQTVSVHIYGGDISKETLNYFDPDAGTVEAVAHDLVYDNES